MSRPFFSFFLPLFTGVREIRILRSSHSGDSAKFVVTEFSEVRGRKAPAQHS